MTFKELIEKHNYSQKKVSEEFEIPYRTVQHWYAGDRECPTYVIKMLSVIMNGKWNE